MGVVKATTRNVNMVSDNIIYNVFYYILIICMYNASSSS